MTQIASRCFAHHRCNLSLRQIPKGDNAFSWHWNELIVPSMNWRRFGIICRPVAASGITIARMAARLSELYPAGNDSIGNFRSWVGHVMGDARVSIIGQMIPARPRFGIWGPQFVRDWHPSEVPEWKREQHTEEYEVGSGAKITVGQPVHSVNDGASGRIAVCDLSFRHIGLLRADVDGEIQRWIRIN